MASVGTPFLSDRDFLFLHRRKGANITQTIAIAVSSQVVKKCPSGNVCFSINVPETTASSGSGDLYFQIQGPASKQWIGLGQGGANQMRNSNIFIIYADSTGSNVTLSPRLGNGEFEPDFNADAQVSLLEGSGIANGVMTANVRCGCFLAVTSMPSRFPLFPR